MTTNQTIDGVPRRICHACVTLPRKAYCPVCDDAPSSQAQGDPVAWQRKSKNVDGRWFALPDSDVEEAIRLGYEVRKLYAEQSAQVAVLLPERREIGPNYPYLSDLDIEWNACLDELKRLNTSL